MKALIIAIAGLCVGTSEAKPFLPEEGYEKIPAMWYGATRCNALGLLSAETAAYGLSILKEDLSQYLYDDRRLQSALDRLTGEDPSAQDCNRIGLLIQQRKLDAEATDRRLRAQQEEQRQLLEATKIAPPVWPMPSIPTTPAPATSFPGGEQYRTILVNTPSGIVYKRCKVLNGQVVACF